MSTMRRLLSAPVGLTVLLALLPGTALGKARAPYTCRDKRDVARPLTLQVDGQPATGRYAAPRGTPKGLVVFGHGYGHTSLSWDGHMREAARRGLLAVTMDYRGLKILPDDNGDGLPSSRGWNAITGGEDLVAAAQFFESMCQVATVTILGVSMGGDMSGLAVAMAGEQELLKSDGETPLFNYWVDVEGATNLIETYNEARAVAGANETGKNAQADIETETGGTFEQKPDEYRRRTVVARVDDIAASGVDTVVIHGIDDGLVPYNQSRELTGLMRDAGITTEMITIGRRDEDSERETTLTGDAAGAIYKDYTSPLSGHASEKSTTHIVMQTALDRLWALMAFNSPPLDHECFVNGQVPAQAARICST
jgi:pimeloyl-ACP methyl ester carboxylesterase